MKKIMYRSYFTFIIVIAVVLGVLAFLIRMFTYGDDWVMLRANQSVFHDGVLNTGTLTDRSGVVLAHASDGVYSYAEDVTVRESCFHVVGDYAGNVGTGALTLFGSRLSGYDPINGTVSIGGKGKVVRLSIDSDMNMIAYNALAGRRGAVIVSNYKNGEILCLVSSPSYDPNTTPDLESSSYEGLYLNRAMGATYTPGSIFKIITLAAAIENITDLENMTFSCTGQVTVGGDIVTCTGIHGEQTIEQAFAHSCNCAFSEISQILGSEIIAEYAKELGLCDSLDLNGAATKAGNFENTEIGTSDLSWSGIGQYTNLLSPFAMLRVVSAVANNGLVAEPSLLKGDRTSETFLMYESTANKIASMMNYNVIYEYGEAVFTGLKINAKTGTAEVGNGNDHSWFVGYLNDNEYPYAFTVIIENGGGGLANAGALANKVLQAAVCR